MIAISLCLLRSGAKSRKLFAKLNHSNASAKSYKRGYAHD